MQTTVIDFETYYDSEYSLRKMTPAEYILDPRFETIGLAVRESWPSNKPTYWVDGPDAQSFFDNLDPNDTCLVSHNALFDMCVVAWRYCFVPRLMVDTLGVSRAVLGHVLKSLSLSNVARHLGLGVKGDTVMKVIGMNRRAIIAAGLYEDYKTYSIGDADLCAGVYDKLVRSGQFPVGEIPVMDMVLRCAIQPEFHIDKMLLAEHLNTVQKEKEVLLARAMCVGVNDKSDLMSNEKFAAVLRSLGVEPPTKTSPVTGKVTYAFAKTDRAMIDLEEHENPAVQAVVAACTGHKSTLEETRTQRIISISNLVWPDRAPARMPMPLRYGGAHTGRLSGDWSLNVQNLPSRGGKDTLRRAFIAPPGHSVLAVDASQIEARIVAWICGQNDLVQQFADGEDVYSLFASDVFGYPVHKKTHPTERFIGKTGILGLGYQVGSTKFSNTVEVQSQLQLGHKVEMPLHEGERVVQHYRTKYDRISGSWRRLQYEGIPVLAQGGSFTFGPCIFSRGCIIRPNGLKLYYHDLHQETGEYGTQWVFTYGGKPKKLYGGATLENVVQSLARDIVMAAAVRIRKRTGFYFKLQVHDELVFIVPTDSVTELRDIVVEEMSRRIDWYSDLPLAAEAGFGPSYGDAK